MSGAKLPKSFSGCPSAETLSDYSAGRLPSEQIEWVARHLEQCAHCDTTMVSMEKECDSFVMSIRGSSQKAEFCQLLEDSSSHILSAEVESPEFRQLVARSKAIFDNESGDHPPRRKIKQGDTRRQSLPPQIGQYRLLNKIGEGGMGVIFKARHVNLKQIVAIKLLAPHRVADSQSLTRFYREMEAIGTLQHPHIVRATDAGLFDGQHALIMEYVEGIDLSRLLRLCGPLSIANACEAIRQAALGLDYIDKNNRIHRDLKPSNLLLSSQGVVKILDLGLARLYDNHTDYPSSEADQEDTTRLGSAATGEATATGDEVLGTADYMAPEQAARAPDINVRADVYGLGCTLYKLLAGAAPFGGPQYDSPRDKLRGHQHHAPPSLSNYRNDLPAELIDLVERMLAKDPAARPSPAKLVKSLTAFCVDSDLSTLIRSAMINAVADDDSDFHSSDEDPWYVSVTSPGRANDKPEAAAKVKTGWRKKARPLAAWLAVGLVVCAVAAFLLPSAGGNRDKPSDNKTGWEAVLADPPSILVGANSAANKNWEFDPTSGALIVSSQDENRLIRLGELPPQGGTIALDIQQAQWNRSAGIFLGYRPDENIYGKPGVRLQLIRLIAFKNSKHESGVGYYYERQKSYIHRGDLAINSEHQVRIPLDHIEPGSAKRIEIRADKRGVHTIMLDGKLIDRLVDPRTQANYAANDHTGQWGIFINGGTCWFSNPQFFLHAKE